jgi:xanthine dehydrogenase iron-sulfur cluster and FAD-binding subunit A
MPHLQNQTVGSEPVSRVPEVSISMTRNGHAKKRGVPAWTTLLDLLRGPLELTGTKKGCDHGQCGATQPEALETAA